MKLLLCHNYYQQRGGEDESFEAEARVLEENGHEVVRYTVHNDSIKDMGRFAIARKTLWNRASYRELRSLIRTERPDVMHCTNTFPLISPSAYRAARVEGLPVVQSLRNYRMLCPGALFLRNGRVCEECLGKSVPWPGVKHGCYRDSRAASAVVASLNVLHRGLGTWRRGVDLYFTLTEFAKRKFVEGGLRADRIVVKPNCVNPDPGPGTGRGGYAIFAGRLSAEKGIDTLLAAWSRLKSPLRLKIVGDGPLEAQVRRVAQQNPNIEYLGRKPLPELLELIGEAACLVMPSVWYETFGRTIIEAYAKGTPVIASRLGAMAELVDETRTGKLFAAGDDADLAVAVEQLLADSTALARMRTEARREFESKYTPAANLTQLLAIYRRAIADREQRSAQPAYRSTR
ncbi:MAG: glycosyltransferase [Gemmataceae bacterium]